MVTVLYTLNNNQKINWGASGDSRIIQNVINLLNTNIYEVAYMRIMGLTRRYLDQPSGSIEGIISTEIMELIDKFEPRASVKSVKLKNIEDDGNVVVEVVVDI